MSYIEEAKQRRRSFADAPHRPRYHFLPPANWMNDPNGVIQWRGRYHLFYQHNPYGPVWGQIHWGHAVSDDLIHWEDLPIALTPTPNGPDEGGCWSGCAVDHNGVPTIFYTGIRGDHALAQSQVTCMAVGSDDLLVWQKHPANPVLTPPTDLDLTGFRDPSVWREDGGWYQLIGAGVRGVGGAALLYRSQDLLEWDYLGPLLSSQHDLGLWTGSIWECPQLLNFGNKRVLIFGVWDDGTHYTVAITGSYQNHRFRPEHVRKLDAGDRHFYAAQTLKDERRRYLMWGWVQEAGPADQNTAGWSGVMSLPRELTLAPGGTLLIRPPEELTGLRERHTRFANVTLAGVHDLGSGGLQLELQAEFSFSGEVCGLSVLRSPDGAEETRIFYDPGRNKLGVDRRRSSLTKSGLPLDVQEGDFELRAGEPLKLHLFLDHSVLEVFANERFCLTSRVYPQRRDSAGLAAFGQDAEFALNVWTLPAIW